MMDTGQHQKGANMTATLEELEQRLGRLELEMAEMRRLLQSTTTESPAERGARLLAQARRDKPRLQAAWAKAMEQMGIRGEPVPPEELRRMMAEDGIKPEENLFSRGIEEMRDE
jgi:hypothetical protein